MDKLLGIEEIAGILGVEVSTVYNWTHRKAIPFIKIGKLVRFRRREIEIWLEEKCIHPKQRNAHNLVVSSPAAGKMKKHGTVLNDYVHGIVKNAKREVLSKR